MSKKMEYGICIFFQGIHYFIPGGKFDQSKNGDVYITTGDEEKGGHISLHKSGEKHYRENDGKTIPLTDEDLLQYIIDDLKQLSEMTVPERKFVINMRETIKGVRRFGGCFDLNCRNKMGAVIDFDVLKEDYIDYLNKHRKIVHQIWGETFNKVEDEEDDFEENEKISQITDKMKVERIPECKYCKDKPRIMEKKKKYIWKKCPRCGGLGFDLEYLEKYRIN